MKSGFARAIGKLEIVLGVVVGKGVTGVNSRGEKIMHYKIQEMCVSGEWVR